MNRMRTIACGTALLFMSVHGLQAHTFETLYAFPKESVGQAPGGALARVNGTLYGATFGGGKAHAGTVYSLDRERGHTKLHQFDLARDGEQPQGVIADEGGNLYGATFVGGSVFKVTPDGRHATLYTFQGGSDGSNPVGALHRGLDGTLYGTTMFGGSGGCNGNGCGTIYKLAPDGTKSVLHVFAGSDGAQPNGGLVADKAGNLYGVTREGGVGCQGFGCGTVYRLSPDGRDSVLYAFQGDIDGETPVGELAIDKEGDLFGVANGGKSLCGGHGLFCGIVFEIALDGTKSTIHAFEGPDGWFPAAGLVADTDGSLYGTTESGGTSCSGEGCGTVFKIAPDGTYTLLHDFAGGKDGIAPDGPLLLTRKGTLYGTVVQGGKTGSCSDYGCGTIFEITP